MVSVYLSSWLGQLKESVFEKSDFSLLSSVSGEYQTDLYSPGNGGQDAINGANWYVNSLPF